MNVRTAIARVDDVIWPSGPLQQQIVKNRDLSISSRRPHNCVDLTRRLVAKFGPIYVIRGNNIFQSGPHDLDRRRRQHEKIELMSIDTGLEEMVEQFNVALQTNALSHFAQVIFSHLRTKLRIMQQ